MPHVRRVRHYFTTQKICLHSPKPKLANISGAIDTPVLFILGCASHLVVCIPFINIYIYKPFIYRAVFMMFTNQFVIHAKWVLELYLVVSNPHHRPS